MLSLVIADPRLLSVLSKAAFCIDSILFTFFSPFLNCSFLVLFDNDLSRTVRFRS